MDVRCFKNVRYKNVIRMHCHFVTHTFLTDSAVMFQGAADPKKVDPRLLTPAVQSFCCCLPAKFRRCIQCNIDRTQVGSARHFLCVGHLICDICPIMLPYDTPTLYSSAILPLYVRIFINFVLMEIIEQNIACPVIYGKLVVMLKTQNTDIYASRTSRFYQAIV